MESISPVIGPNQRTILRILRNHPHLTTVEIACKIYHKTVNVGDFEYAATSKSLNGLRRKGLVEKTHEQVQWCLGARGRLVVRGVKIKEEQVQT